MNKKVFVTNRGVNFSTVYCNEKIDFRTNEEVEISEVVAKHLFGYGEDNKEPYFVRLGWMKMNTDLEKAERRLSEFAFASEPSKKVHLSAPVVERVAAPMPMPRGVSKGVAKVQPLQ
jgi:hypothetical protein